MQPARCTQRHDIHLGLEQLDDAAVARNVVTPLCRLEGLRIVVAHRDEPQLVTVSLDRLEMIGRDTAAADHRDPDGSIPDCGGVRLHASAPVGRYRRPGSPASMRICSISWRSRSYSCFLIFRKRTASSAFASMPRGVNRYMYAALLRLFLKLWALTQPRCTSARRQ